MWWTHPVVWLVEHLGFPHGLSAGLGHDPQVPQLGRLGLVMTTQRDTKVESSNTDP